MRGKLSRSISDIESVGVEVLEGDPRALVAIPGDGHS